MKKRLCIVLIFATALLLPSCYVSYLIFGETRFQVSAVNNSGEAIYVVHSRIYAETPDPQEPEYGNWHWPIDPLQPNDTLRNYDTYNIWPHIDISGDWRVWVCAADQIDDSLGYYEIKKAINKLIEDKAFIGLRDYDADEMESHHYTITYPDDFVNE